MPKNGQNWTFFEKNCSEGGNSKFSAGSPARESHTPRMHYHPGAPTIIQLKITLDVGGLECVEKIPTLSYHGGTMGVLTVVIYHPSVHHDPIDTTKVDIMLFVMITS